ncbi:CoA transferase subunit A [Paralcaligenes ureilyticus]|uniref:Glutaconate CoA-transferase subunit A n=1 Tax=Paralcaligenes ureilyticus TaxID=627131 RepID=A0A4R3M4K7_9BURK|nr:CoA-transferase [Paralcaligenes ureilyticus]TCT06317.1 glutaconate CoA-transferase subunit A [Paralcaligenes ureilyticus]
MGNKVLRLEDAAALIQDGSSITFGGSFLQRVPAAFVRELARQHRSNLHLIKASPSYDADLLALANAITSTVSGMVGFERPYGGAPNFRRKVELGTVHYEEQTCPTIGAGMRASAQGTLFMPLPPSALEGSDIPGNAGLKSIADPYTGTVGYAMRRLRPDWAVIHVAEADELGNGRLPLGAPPFWDHLLTQSAAKVILTTERLVSDEVFRDEPHRTLVAPYRVHAVVKCPSGAWPTPFFPLYDADDPAIVEYLALDESDLPAYLSSTEACDRGLAINRTVRPCAKEVVL